MIAEMNWASQGKAGLVIFWDYDTQWGADRSRSKGGRKTWGMLDFVNTERILEIHNEWGIPCCFAVVGAAAEPGERPYHDPAQIRRIADAGHEIASHSHSHEWIPALSPTTLRKDLLESKMRLEDCIGKDVVCFVPPFNQPFDYSRRLSISLSERLLAGRNHIGLKELCAMLNETGYKVCRTAYRSICERGNEFVYGRRKAEVARLESIAGVTSIRMNAPCGFDERTVAMLDYCVGQRGLLVAYAHPHSLSAGNSQDARHLVEFLKRASLYRNQGVLRYVLPRTLSS
jgi:peptidoglycan/xylan/chitin deacetylase (PgdA/CDA1 family)